MRSPGSCTDTERASLLSENLGNLFVCLYYK
jgi:hypothetical protein